MLMIMKNRESTSSDQNPKINTDEIKDPRVKSAVFILLDSWTHVVDCPLNDESYQKIIRYFN